MPSLQFIIARDRPDVWTLWTEWFAGVPEIQLILDRRQGERRQRAEARQQEQRRAERRRQQIDDEVRQTGFAIVSG